MYTGQKSIIQYHNKPFMYIYKSTLNQIRLKMENISDLVGSLEFKGVNSCIILNQ